MRALSAVLFAGLLGCRPGSPASPADLEGGGGREERPAEPGTAPEGEAEAARPREAAAAPTPRVDRIPRELAALASAALGAEDLPETSFALPARRGEELVQLQGDRFPEVPLTVTAALLKVDVTLEGCGEGGGLTLGLLQTSGGLRLVGLGDQFRRATGPSPTGLDDVAAAARVLLEALERGEAGPAVLGLDECGRAFGGEARCRRIFQELPTDAALARYGAVLRSCEAEPVYALDVVGLFLTDGAGTELQGMARMGSRDGRLVLTAPIVIAAAAP